MWCFLAPCTMITRYTKQVVKIKKPQIITLHNSTRGGVDVVDINMNVYSVSKKVDTDL